MTNFNERLDEILSTIVDDNKLRPHGRVAPGTCSCGFNAYSVKGIMLDYGDILRAHIDGCMEKVKAYEAIVEEAKQAITSLIKELVAGAIPEDNCMDCTGVMQFEQNLLKSLEEK